MRPDGGHVALVRDGVLHEYVLSSAIMIEGRSIFVPPSSSQTNISSEEQSCSLALGNA